MELDLKNHKNEAEKERQYYNHAHICYDWAQNVFHHSKLVKFILKLLFAAHIFGQR